MSEQPGKEDYPPQPNNPVGSGKRSGGERTMFSTGVHSGTPPRPASSSLAGGSASLGAGGLLGMASRDLCSASGPPQVRPRLGGNHPQLKSKDDLREHFCDLCKG